MIPQFSQEWVSTGRHLSTALILSYVVVWGNGTVGAHVRGPQGWWTGGTGLWWAKNARDDFWSQSSPDGQLFTCSTTRRTLSGRLSWSLCWVKVLALTGAVTPEGICPCLKSVCCRLTLMFMDIVLQQVYQRVQAQRKQSSSKSRSSLHRTWDEVFVLVCDALFTPYFALHIPHKQFNLCFINH